MCRSRVFDRDGNRCVRCGSVEWLQWSHVYTRRILCLRWDLRNSKVLCASCHRWWHDNPAESGPWWRAWVGDEIATDLARIRKELPDVDMESLREQLQGVNQDSPRMSESL